MTEILGQAVILLLRHLASKIERLLSDAKREADRIETRLVEERARVEYLEGLLSRIYHSPARFALPRELREEIVGNIPKKTPERRSG